MNATQKQSMYERIEKHGQQLLAIFPHATTQDPFGLCRLLRRREVQLSRLAVAYCNGAINADHIDAESKRHLRAVNKQLGSADRVWFNRDPRGYALKIDLQAGEKLYRDCGGYGIIAPDLSDND